jgi:sensor domain CHASE-containing protein
MPAQSVVLPILIASLIVLVCVAVAMHDLQKKKNKASRDKLKQRLLTGESGAS